jgi:hypothetical protein
MTAARRKQIQESAVLSIDLASARYRDIGISLLEAGQRRVQILKPQDLGLQGTPKLEALTSTLAAFCQEHGVRVLLLDGPQGWKSPKTGIEHMRLCERVLNTPGKTGTVGHVKPATYLRYVALSISLFHSLRVDHGWSLVTEDWDKDPDRRWAVESYPSKAWETLGLARLPGKSRATKEDLRTRREDLALITGYEIPEGLTHDELQATVVLPAGRAMAQGDRAGVILCGMDPLITRKGDVLEGWIVEPRIA